MALTPFQHSLVTFLITILDLTILFLRSLLAPVEAEVIDLTNTPTPTPVVAPAPLPHYAAPPRAAYHTYPRQLVDPDFFHEALAQTYEEEGEAMDSEDEEHDFDPEYLTWCNWCEELTPHPYHLGGVCSQCHTENLAP